MNIREATIVAILLTGSATELVGTESLARPSRAQQETAGEHEREVINAALEKSSDKNELGMPVRPDMLADLIDTLAGAPVRLLNARVVGVFDPQVFLVESQTRLRPMIDRNRVLVFVEAGTLRVDAARLVASTVTIAGVARTLLGMQTSREVAWPAALTREAVERLEIRAAVLAKSVRTPEGTDLLARPSAHGCGDLRGPDSCARARPLYGFADACLRAVDGGTFPFSRRYSTMLP